MPMDFKKYYRQNAVEKIHNELLLSATARLHGINMKPVSHFTPDQVTALSKAATAISDMNAALYLLRGVNNGAVSIPKDDSFAELNRNIKLKEAVLRKESNPETCTLGNALIARKAAEQDVLIAGRMLQSTIARFCVILT
jgi:hypothetical protein